MKKLSVVCRQSSVLVTFVLTLFAIYYLLSTPTLAFDIAVPSSVPQPVSNAAEAGKSTQNVLNTIITLIFVVGMLGTLLYTLWGAVEWITSGGDKEKVGSARKKISTALIGLVVLALAFVIVTLVGKLIGIDFAKLPAVSPLGTIK